MRQEFVDHYMTRSALTPYTLEGERVSYTFSDGTPMVQYALECRCEYDDCEGWAMVSEESQNWHRSQNGLTDMTAKEAIAADMAIRALLDRQGNGKEGV